MANNVLELKTNWIVKVYTQYGSKVNMVLCPLCALTKRADRVGNGYRNTAKPCERCGKLSDSVVMR